VVSEQYRLLSLSPSPLSTPRSLPHASAEARTSNMEQCDTSPFGYLIHISITLKIGIANSPASTSPESGSVYRSRKVCLSVASASFRVIIPDKSTNFFALFCLRVWYCRNVSSRSESLGLCSELLVRSSTRQFVRTAALSMA